MMPLSAVWAGPERNEHLGGAAAASMRRTEGATPFRFSLHVGDVGHTLVVGPTGAGKSVLLALMALQFRRYAGAQVFAFDFGGSIRAAALAMGGDWHDLGGALAGDAAEPVALQPLARIDDAGGARLGGRMDRRPSWPARASRSTPDGEGPSLVGADLAWPPRRSHERTLTGLAVLLQSSALKRALRALRARRPLGPAARRRGRAAGRGRRCRPSRPRG